MKEKAKVVTMLLAALMMFSVPAIPSFAFVYPNGSTDDKYEIFGPRVDRILIKEYPSPDAEIAALQNGEIDITDWHLTKAQQDMLTGNPDIGFLDYQGDPVYYTLNFNNGNDQYFGDPPDPFRPNPVYPNPCSNVIFRQALGSLIDVEALTGGPLGYVYKPIHRPMPYYMTPLFDPPPDPPMPNLDVNGFPIGPDGFRYWDRNGNFVKDPDEGINLRVCTRADDLRKTAGDMLEAGLIAQKIPYTRIELTSGQAIVQILDERNYNVYTGGWGEVGPQWDYLYDLYHWDGYEDQADYGFIGKDDPVLQQALEDFKNAPDTAERLVAYLTFEERFCTQACEKPLASPAAPKAYHKWYTGGNNGVIAGDAEDAYRGDAWTDLVNQRALGIDSWWSTLNMYPVGHEWGDTSHMTIRYGARTTAMPLTVNPLYASIDLDTRITNRIYDTLAKYDPNHVGGGLPYEVPQLAENWTWGMWVDQDGLYKYKITVEVRSDVLWSDGQPFTIDDVIYTLCEMPLELRTKGCGDVTWQPTVDTIAGYYKNDPYTATFLLKSSSLWEIDGSHMLLGNIIIPKHFWQPFIAGNDVSTICGDLTPAQNIGTGPFLYVSNTPGVSVLLERNPLYYADREVDPVTEGDPIGALFEAASPSIQLSPVKISHQATGLGNALITVILQNHNKMSPVTVNYGIELLVVEGSGSSTSVGSGTGITIVAGGQYNAAVDVPKTLMKGKYNLVVTITVTAGAKIGTSTYSKTVFVTVEGDINEDGMVDIFDIALIAIAFGSVRGQPGYNGLADINRDGVIDIMDIVKVAIAYGYLW